MEKASKIIAAMEANNPKRCLEYFFGILRGRFGVPEGVSTFWYSNDPEPMT